MKNKSKRKCNKYKIEEQDNNRLRKNKNFNL